MSVQELNEVRDIPLEQMLAELGVEFKVARVDLIKIDSNVSRLNHGRVSPLNKEVVEQYANAERRGARFPMYCLRFSPKTGAYQILGGCHRNEKDKLLGKSTVMAYVVEVDDMMAAVIAMQANALNGIRTTQDEQVTQAMRLVREFGMSIKGAAEKMNVSVNLVTQALQADDVRNDMLGEFMCDSRKVEALSMNAFRKIHTLKPIPSIYEAACKAITELQMDGGQVAEFVEEIKKAKTEAEKMQCITTRKMNKKQPSGLERPNRTGLIRALTTIANFATKFPTLASMQLTMQDQSGDLQRLLSKAESELLRVKRLLQ